MQSIWRKLKFCRLITGQEQRYLLPCSSLMFTTSARERMVMFPQCTTQHGLTLLLVGITPTTLTLSGKLKCIIYGNQSPEITDRKWLKKLADK